MRSSMKQTAILCGLVLAACGSGTRSPNTGQTMPSPAPEPVAAAPAPAPADPALGFRLQYANPGGMWLPQQMTLPLHVETFHNMGVAIDAKTLSDPLASPLNAVVSLGGCTASFVSPDGLIVTNHHCAYNSIRVNSTPQRDLLKNGFLANSIGDELPAAPGSRVSVTTKIEDVTDQVTGALLREKLDDRARDQEITRREKQLVADCEKPGGVRCRVASMFEGTQYLRFTQMEIRDVRLVYAP